jgi:hypothetical protein
MVLEQAELIVGVFIEAIKKGDWRAAEALLQRVCTRRTIHVARIRRSEAR